MKGFPGNGTDLGEWDPDLRCNVRHTEPRPGYESFRWVVGEVGHEHRFAPIDGACCGFSAEVSFFKWLGHGSTRDEAIAMAGIIQQSK